MEEKHRTKKLGGDSYFPAHLSTINWENSGEEKGISQRLWIATQVISGLLANEKSTKNTTTIFNRIFQLFLPKLNISFKIAEYKEMVTAAYDITDELLDSKYH